jgi:hypothetical protein
MTGETGVLKSFSRFAESCKSEYFRDDERRGDEYPYENVAVFAPF